MFSDFFKFCNFRLPVTKFCKSVLDEYPIHISQLHPLGLVKLHHFKFACIALGHIPEITVFWAFLFWCGNPCKDLHEIVLKRSASRNPGP
ncbi:hypothetical protein Hanom_Chr11g01032001 [Helianthus anomalus]